VAVFGEEVVACAEGTRRFSLEVKKSTQRGKMIGMPEIGKSNIESNENPSLGQIERVLKMLSER
jgi:hypothetical protein